MPRMCSICIHQKRPNIDAQILAQVPYGKIAEEFGVSKTTLSRHRSTHLASRVAEVVNKRKEEEESNLIGYVEHLRQRSLNILDRAETSNSLAICLGAIREARESIRLLAQLTNQLATDKPVTNIFVSSDWQRFFKILLTTVKPYKEVHEMLIRQFGGVPLIEPPATADNGDKMILEEEENVNGVSPRDS